MPQLYQYLNSSWFIQNLLADYEHFSQVLDKIVNEMDKGSRTFEESQFAQSKVISTLAAMDSLSSDYTVRQYCNTAVWDVEPVDVP